MSDAETLPTLEAVTNAIKHQRHEVDGAAAVRAFLADLAPDLAAAKRAVQEATTVAQEIAPRLAEIDRALAGVGEMEGSRRSVLGWMRHYRQDLGRLLEEVGRFSPRIAAVEATTPEMLATRRHPGADARLVLSRIISRPRELHEAMASVEDQTLQLRRLGVPESVAPTLSAGPMPPPPEARPTYAVSPTAEPDR